MKFLISAIMIFLVSAGSYSQTDSQDKISPRLRLSLETASAVEDLLVWIFFTDKGAMESLKKSVPLSVVSEKAIARRLSVLSQSEVVSYSDLPVEQTYVELIRPHVRQIRQQSKWFNAVSARATREQIKSIVELSCVKEIELVARFRRKVLEPGTSEVPPTSTQSLPKHSSSNALDYGPSLNQSQLSRIPEIHNTGNSAQGIIIGVFDNGFRLPGHESLASINIIGTYDFVDKKVSVVPNNPSTAHGSHGVNTLSTIGGFKAGQLIGPAYGASYLLARTENDSSETPIEEDNWAAAIEWAESLGVQITSTSLGYDTYDPPYTSWTWQDMNGRTTIITRAAAMAVRRGVLVVNSAGNSGFNATRNTLLAPADGDSVFSIGAATRTGGVASFSSGGPTTSSPPRIKPDVLAQGTEIYAANSSITNGYIYTQGTSFSCPIAAGIAALLLKAKPNATPVEIMDAMRSTASRATNPDNQWGWGIVNGWEALVKLAGFVPPQLPTSFELSQNYPNPFNAGTQIQVALPEDATVAISIYNVLGQRVRNLFSGRKASSLFEVHWDGRNDSNIPVATGVYVYQIKGMTASGKTLLDSKKMTVLR